MHEWRTGEDIDRILETRDATGIKHRLRISAERYEYIYNAKSSPISSSNNSTNTTKLNPQNPLYLQLASSTT